MTALYDVTVRTADKGYLAFEYRLTLDELDTNPSHQRIKNDPRYVVSMKFVGAA